MVETTKVFWPDMTKEERVQAIKDGVREGLSAAQIAKGMDGVTRSAICGLARREGVKLAYPSNRDVRRRTEAKLKPVAKPRQSPKVLWSETPKATKPSKEEKRESKPPRRRPNKAPDLKPLTTMGELEPDRCNWIRAEDDADGNNTPMCGRRTKGRWCEFHTRRGHRLRRVGE